MTSSVEPRFSIVVPAYNEAAYIGPALQALLQQDFAEPYEIIVVDNDSTDRTGEIAASYGVTVVRKLRGGSARGGSAARSRHAVRLSCRPMPTRFRLETGSLGSIATSAART